MCIVWLSFNRSQTSKRPGSRRPVSYTAAVKHHMQPTRNSHSYDVYATGVRIQQGTLDSNEDVRAALRLFVSLVILTWQMIVVRCEAFGIGTY